MVPKNVGLQIEPKAVVPEVERYFCIAETKIGHRSGHRTAAKFGHHAGIELLGSVFSSFEFLCSSEYQH